MHPVVDAWLRSLTFGITSEPGKDEETNSAVGSLARVYEIARNAMEFRADHLVRRAAIERILRRQLMFGKNTEELAEKLWQELKWAMYVTEVEEKIISQKRLGEILNKLVNYGIGKPGSDWLLGLVSAEIEELLNPNTDYHRFTGFAFSVLKKKMRLPQEGNPELVLYMAIDKTYSQSDAQQCSYHMYKLIRNQLGGDKAEEKLVLEETKKYFRLANESKNLNRIMAYVRRQMGPLVLLRDMYFMNPKAFIAALADKSKFAEVARTSLSDQLQLMGRRISTARSRSLVYVFLTKMLLALVVEIPIDRLLVGHVNYWIMGVNVVIPVLVMWLLTATVKLPRKAEQEKLLDKTWQIVADFDAVPHEGEILSDKKEKSKIKYGLFYLFYAFLFMAIFAGIISGLFTLGYSLASVFIFLFFLSIVCFFAFRIKQTAQVYSFNESSGGRTSLVEAVMLPIVVVGGYLSSGVAKLNFLVFVFDFILEAPFKMILRFLDSWLAFLNARKDEAVG